MGLFDAISSLAETLAELAGDHHAAMMPAGAAERDGQIALAFLDIVRQQIDQQGGDALDEFLSLGERPDIARYAGILSAEFLKRRNVVGIRQEADVEHQVAVGWKPMAEPKASDVHQNAGTALALPAEGGM